MKKFAIYLFALLLIHQAASSQSCLPEGIRFYTQSQIDDFQINYPGCTEIDGDVLIDSNLVTNLNGLENLSYVGDYLEIGSTDFGGNESLTDLSGLE